MMYYANNIPISVCKLQRLIIYNLSPTVLRSLLNLILMVDSLETKYIIGIFSKWGETNHNGPATLRERPIVKVRLMRLKVRSFKIFSPRVNGCRSVGARSSGSSEACHKLF